MHESLEERDVLIIGGGFAGGYVARLLRGRRATIVSPENFMLYTPLLPEAASGTLEPRHTVVPLRAMCPHADLLLARAESLDLEVRKALSARDKLYLGFADSFEKKFINQGLYENRDIDATLDLGWNLLSVLPESELKRIDPATIKKYHPKYRGKTS